jgi:hypothetical protein
MKPAQINFSCGSCYGCKNIKKSKEKTLPQKIKKTTHTHKNGRTT